MKRKAKDLINHAYQNRYAVASVNVSNLETIMGAFEAANEYKSPILLQIAPVQLEMQHLTFELTVKLVDVIATKFPDVNYAIHLDHATSYILCSEAIRQGFESIMFDGSSLPFSENLKITKSLKDEFPEISLEGELGSFQNAEGNDVENNAEFHYTNPNQAFEFVTETKVDFLAISFGNNHGFYKKEPNLDFDLLEKISNLVNIPLVLHGGSGLPNEDIQKAISLGISKVNFFTQNDYAFTTAYLNASKDKPYMIKAVNKAQEAFCQSVKECIELCRSKGENYG
jgi:fructose-bisphosphate aldolase, class II